MISGYAPPRRGGSRTKAEGGAPVVSRMSPPFTARVLTRCALVLAAAAAVTLTPTAQPIPSDALAHHRTLGKAFYENPTTSLEAVEEFAKALALAPESARDRVNYALALLRAGRNAEGVAELERAQRLDPGLPHTWFNLGIEYKRSAKSAQAVRQFQQMLNLVPDEPKTHYNLAVLYRQGGRTDDAMRHLEIAARHDATLAGVHFQLARLYRAGGRAADADREERLFNEARRRQAGAAVPEDLEWSVFSEIVDPYDSTTAREDAPAIPLQFEETVLTPGGKSDGRGVGIIDADGDGRPDLLAWSDAGVVVFRGGRHRASAGDLDGAVAVRAIVPGDFDNDGRSDLCVVAADDGATLYRNANGRFVRYRRLAEGHFDAAVWIDYDHDYDLDLMLLGEASRLYRNNGAAGFTDRTGDMPFQAGWATSAIVFDPHPDVVARDVIVGYQDRTAVIYRDRMAGRFEAVGVPEAPAGLRALAAADLDYDGATDLVFGDEARAIVLRNRLTGFDPIVVTTDGRSVLPVDLENRAVLDLVGASQTFRNLGDGRFDGRGDGPGPHVAAVAADLDGDGRVDLAVVRPDGALSLLRNVAATTHAWIAVRMSGVKNLKSAAQAQVEVKRGRRYQKQAYAGVPLHFGLRGATAIDVIRITWPNGLVQNELNPPLGRVIDYQEAPRLSGSCPMVFAWNGRGFQFVTDVLGVAPLGASAGDGAYFPTDADEYIQIPGETLALTNGGYEIRITEELKEVAYLDQVQLIAVDHPAGVNIISNDKFKAPPFPEFRLYGIRQRIRPVRATDGDGRDVTSLLIARDGRYPDAFERTIAGAAQRHSLTLDFGAAVPDNRAVLVLNGWVDWADGSTFRGVAQERPGGLAFPSLQVRDRQGHWTTVVEDMGMPAGKPKTIAVDLTGRFLSDSREVRILTDLSLYWDEIFLSPDADGPTVSLTPIPATTAELRFHGFSTPLIDPARTQPESFDYSRPLLLPHATWNPTPGLYTRFGDVRALLAAADDELVIMGSGDEVALRFRADAVPALRPGWRRDFLLRVNGWAKDSDANTAFSQQVEPLPFRGMSVYPYPDTERFPDTERHRRYRAQYNTRPALRLLLPLAPTDVPARPGH